MQARDLLPWNWHNDAKFKKGVLEVRIPRSEEARQSRRSVPIESS